MKLFSKLFIFATLVTFWGNAEAIDVNAGPIFNPAQAGERCPGLCEKAFSQWNGNWKTTVPNEMSVCGCKAVEQVTAGPIMSNTEAPGKCPPACQAVQGQWNKQWTTTVQGRESECGCIIG